MLKVPAACLGVESVGALLLALYWSRSLSFSPSEELGKV